MIYAWGVNDCLNMPPFFDDKASSFRFPGDLKDFRIDTLNFYEGFFFMGDEETLYENKPHREVSFGR